MREEQNALHVCVNNFTIMLWKNSPTASVYYTECKPKNKNEGGLEMRLRSHLCYGETASPLCCVKIHHQGVSCHLMLPNEEFATRNKMQPSDRHPVLKRKMVTPNYKTKDMQGYLPPCPMNHITKSFREQVRHNFHH